MTSPILCKEAEITMKTPDNITFGNGCIVHPKAVIYAEEGCEIRFGEYNIIEEKVVIRAVSRYNSMLNNNSQVSVFIGSYNHFKVGAKLENTSVVDCNVFDYNVEIEDSFIDSKTIITPTVKLPKRANIKSGSVVLDNKIIVSNSSFKESEFKRYITEMYNLLAGIIPKHYKLHSISG